MKTQTYLYVCAWLHILLVGTEENFLFTLSRPNTWYSSLIISFDFPHSVSLSPIFFTVNVVTQYHSHLLHQHEGSKNRGAWLLCFYCCHNCKHHHQYCIGIGATDATPPHTQVSTTTPQTQVDTETSLIWCGGVFSTAWQCEREREG